MREGSLPRLHRGRHDGAKLCGGVGGGPQVRGGGLAQVRSAAAATKVWTEVEQETEEEEVEQGRILQSSPI